MSSKRNIKTEQSSGTAVFLRWRSLGRYSAISYRRAHDERSATLRFLAAISGQRWSRVRRDKAQLQVPAGATAVYTSSGLAYYRHTDHLGSSRLATTPSRTLYSSTAYAPFGESYNQTGTTDLSFTGDDQDTVSGMYDTLYRKQMPVQGRWLTPDPAGMGAVDPTSPQTWNRYGYVANDPLSFVDPLGLQLIGPVRCSSSGANTCPGGTIDSGAISPGGDGSVWSSALGGMLFNVTQYDFSGGPNFQWDNFDLSDRLGFASQGEINLLGITSLGVVDMGGGTGGQSGSGSAGGGFWDSAVKGIC